MSEVEVPFGDNASETAVLLLAAAEDLGLEPYVVRTASFGAFLVPKEVNDKAFKPKKAVAKKAAANKKDEE